MIQIIKGTFGYYNGRKVVPITNADGPQKFNPGLEARLVKKGIAKYITAPTAAQPEAPESPDRAGAPASQDPAASEGDPETPDGNLPEYNEDMKLDDLKEVAKACGVDASAMRKKADVIAAIEAAQQAGDGDDEEPPQLGAADPI